MANLRKWSTSASGNATVAGGANTISFAEGQSPGSVNNSAREMMAQVRSIYTPSEWGWVEHSATVSVASQTTFKLTGDQRTNFSANRRVRLKSGSSTRYASIVSSSFTTETTITVTVDSGSLSASHSLVALSMYDGNNLPQFVTSNSASAMIAAALVPYVTSNSLSAAFASYVTSNSMSAAIANYVTSNSASVMIAAKFVLDTAQASTSGTSIDFTSIPSWVKRITIMFRGVSTSGSSNVQVQIGDSGGVEATGYISTVTDESAAAGNSTTGFISALSGAADVLSGTITLCHMGSNAWVANGNLKSSTSKMYQSTGDKALSDVLDRVRITTVGGANTFDAGSINIMYE